MKPIRKAALATIAAVFALSLPAGWIAPHSYSQQFRNSIAAPASRQFLLGTDDLGRDRFSRLLHGTRITLSLAPAAALLSTILAIAIGGAAGYAGGWWDRIAVRAINLCLSLPAMFLFLILRAILPLNVSPAVSMASTFTLMAMVGWAASARVLRANARDLRNSDFILQARACGCRGPRLLFRHIAPNLRPVLLAQFWTSIPLFVLGEANLGLLGLGVAEPLPSWGNLLRELESGHGLATGPCAFVSLALLVLVVSCLQLALPSEDLA